MSKRRAKYFTPLSDFDWHMDKLWGGIKYAVYMYESATKDVAVDYTRVLNEWEDKKIKYGFGLLICLSVFFSNDSVRDWGRVGTSLIFCVGIFLGLRLLYLKYELNAMWAVKHDLESEFHKLGLYVHVEPYNPKDTRECEVRYRKFSNDDKFYEVPYSEVLEAFEKYYDCVAGEGESPA
jgi:hypothetical protein